MSSIIDNSGDEALNPELRVSEAEDTQKSEVPTFKVKPRIPATGALGAADKPQYTPEEIVAASKILEQQARDKAATAQVNVSAIGQVINKSNVNIKEVDFSKLSMDDIYDLTIPIQAKPFGSEDALKVDLKDKTYEARWVNKNPRRLGQMMSYGFVYVVPDDLAKKLEVEVIPDAQGHFTLDDVVLMRIPKVIYYGALRAAHERAVNTVSSVGAQKAAANQAAAFMAKTSGNFTDAVADNKISFYKPGITI